MKINPFSAAIQFISSVREKQDAGDRSNGNAGYERQEKKKDQNKEDTPEFATPEKVGAAIDSFAQDAVAQSNGLSAQMEGKGPGLKVILKDGTGAIIRQFTGEEFLKLREAAGRDSKSRGKILDQKL